MLWQSVQVEYSNVLPVVFLLFLRLHVGRRGLLEPVPAVNGREAGHTLVRSPACRRAATLRVSLYSCIHPPSVSLDR